MQLQVLDDTERAFYEMRFELECYKFTGEQFQELFSDAMGKAYPRDFIKVRPWGNSGDRKNDGYRRSTRTIYQVYAPKTAASSKVVAKIEEDFKECIPHWEEYFDIWCFVHNDLSGIGPQFLELLLRLDKSHGKVSVNHWGIPELRTVVFSLSRPDLQHLFGCIAPSRQSVIDVSSNDIATILQQIPLRAAPSPQSIRPVSDQKLKYNALSPSVGELLRVGMSRAQTVREIISGYYDPLFGDKLAQSFRERYECDK